ncbi:MAG: hypothetical protein E6J90_53035 [Deltaproteobacteria bacterium]|nr:MAG: hypothetical protein E6J90_53035 [Deltaproteobacteria bacterium]
MNRVPAAQRFQRPGVEEAMVEGRSVEDLVGWFPGGQQLCESREPHGRGDVLRERLVDRGQHALGVVDRPDLDLRTDLDELAGEHLDVVEVGAQRAAREQPAGNVALDLEIGAVRQVGTLGALDHDPDDALAVNSRGVRQVG